MPFIYDRPGQKFPATQQVGPDEWIHERPFWHVDPVTGKKEVVPPSGPGTVEQMIAGDRLWTTDYRSGPDFLDASIPKQGKYSAAWVRHDFDYTSRRKSKWQADRDLRDALGELGANLYQRNKVFVILTIAGWPAWKAKNKRRAKQLREFAATF